MGLSGKDSSTEKNERDLRHCMVVHAHFPLGESRVEREANALINDGYHVDVICLRSEEEPAEETGQGLMIYRLPVKRNKGSGLANQLLEYLTFFFLAFFKLSRLHLRNRYNSVQVHNLPDFLVFSALIPKISGAHVILDIHDLMPEFFTASYNRSMDSLPVRLLILQEQLSCRFADHVITVTDRWRETLIRRGVPSEKVSVVMNVADNTIFVKHREQTSPNRQEDHFNLIYHGTLAYRYGIDLLVRAAARARQEVPGLHVTIHGKGEFLDELVALVEELNLQEQVHFSTSFVPISELPKFLAQADVGLVPNRSDPFTDDILPTKLMEYVALGIPVIAARTRAIESYFDDSMIQFFTPDDADELSKCIVSAYHNQGRLAQLAKNADYFNRRYSWEKISAGYVDLINRMNNHTRPTVYKPGT